MIKQFFCYIYYRVYFWQLRLYGIANCPNHAAQFTIMMLGIFNLLTLNSIISIIIGIDIVANLFELLKINHITKSYQLIFLLIAWLLIDQLIVRNNLPKKLEKEFKSESPRDKLKGTFFIWCYVITSIFAVLFSVYLDRFSRDSSFTVFSYIKQYIASMQ